MKSRFTNRNGSTLTELVVGAALTVTAMSVIAPLAIRCGRMRQETRHQLLVMDELSNQLERLTSIPAQQRDAALAELTPSESLKSALPSAELTAEPIRDSQGERIVLSLDWDRLGDPPPVSLVGWIDPLSTEEAALLDDDVDAISLVARTTGERR